ncbi:MAG: glycogen-binding domain-containing protein [Candidatus Sumerlaeaceae bacterium]|nr:glycogen-binding domain-containing protein [Candidatus Sumerlaeaceae bacterium]
MKRHNSGFWAGAATAMVVMLLGIGFAAPPSIEIKPATAPGKWTVTFRYEPGAADTVHLAGTFNDWSPTATPMTQEGSAFKASLTLPDGEYQYKFVVNGSDWRHDPLNPHTADDNNGGLNSVLKVSAAEAAMQTTASASTGPLAVEPLPDGKYRVTFRLKDTSAKTAAVAGTFNGWNTTANLMKREGADMVATVDLVAGQYEYKFVLEDSTWLTDPSNPLTADDGRGNTNSVLRLGISSAVPAKAEPTAAPKIVPCPSVAVEPLGQGRNRVTFRHLADRATSVSLAGSFNGWDVGKNPMKRSDGEYVVTVELKDGKHVYKFVEDGERWVADPRNPATAEDGMGGLNSVLKIGEAPAH